jgi:hypothetical protein
MFTTWTSSSTPAGNLALDSAHIVTYIRCMKMISMWIDPKQLAELKAFGKKKGGLKYSQVIRMAIAEFLERQKGATK